MSLNDIIGCTALGFYCMPCKTALKKENVRQHLRRAHPTVVDTHSKGEVRNFLSSLAFTSSKVPMVSCLTGNIKRGLQCSKCYEFFVGQQRWIFDRHVQNMKDKCVGARSVSVSYRDTVCFRQFIIQQEAQAQGPAAAADIQEPTISQAAQPQRLSMNETCKVALATGSALDEIHVEQANCVSSNVISAYVRDDESPNTWAVHFECLMGGGAENFAARMRQLVSWWSVDVDDDCEPYLAKFIRLGNFWLHNYAYNQLKRLPANIRNKLIVFDAHEFGGSLYGGSFFLRKTEGRLEEENRCLVAFCWRFESSYLDDMKAWFKNLVDAKKPLEEMVSHGVFQKFLLKIHFQESHGPRDVPPMAVQYSLSRCFKGFSANDGPALAPLLMIDCQAGGTRVSNTLHLLRAALLGVLYLWPNYETEYQTTPSEGTWSPSWIAHGLNLAEKSRTCYVTNIISPMIADTRSMSASKPSELTSSTDSEGNISIGQFTFHASKWHTLIPTLHQKAIELFGCILAGTSWRELASASSSDRRSAQHNIVLDTTVTSDFALSPTFSWTCIDEIVSSQSLKLKEDTNDLQFNRLSALVQLIFHGLGTGAMRQSQTVCLETFHVLFRGPNQCYYHSKSNKSFHGQHRRQLSSNPLVRHKVPPSLCWIIYLYRVVVSLYGLNSGSREMIRFKGSTSALFSMTRMLAEIFQLFKAPTALEMRHLWTALSNIVDPENGLGIVRVSAGVEMSQKSHHSASTHSSTYATNLADGEEKLFEAYHAALGEPTSRTHVENLQEAEAKLVSEESIMKALKVLFGVNAQFLNDSQRDLVWYSINGFKKQHIHVSTSCGGGKSLAWILPVVVKLMLRWRFGMTIVVVPYNFLERHHCSSAEILLKGKRTDATTASISLGEIDPNKLPHCLQEHRRPRLLFVSVDAMSFLLQHHINYLRKMVEDGELDTVCVDEVHTVWGERAFRPAYDRLNNLPSLGCTVVTLTGSLPPILVPVLASCLGLTADPNNGSDMTIIKGGDPIGYR